MLMGAERQGENSLSSPRTQHKDRAMSETQASRHGVQSTNC